ncbi:ankyrin repeat-containing protein, partial [Chrysochromulina tobinii]
MAAAAPLPNTAPMPNTALLPKAAERSALVAQQQQQEPTTAPTKEPTTAPIASPSRKSGGAQHGAKSGAGRKVSKPTEEGDEVDAELSSSVHPSLRGIREHAHLLKCQRVTAERMHELAAVLGASLEGMRAQLTTARAHALVGEAHREAELQGLLQDGRVELARLKKLNRELAEQMGSGSSKAAAEKAAAEAAAEKAAAEKAAAEKAVAEKAAAEKAAAEKAAAEKAAAEKGSDRHLWQAAKDGDEAELRRLIGLGWSGGFTGLMQASLNGHEGCVRLLLEAEAIEVNAKNIYDVTALHYAAAMGRLAIAKRLLEGGADPTLRDIDGKTAIDDARRNGKSEVVALLSEPRYAARMHTDCP